jgi:hypothetical protein
MAFVRLTFCKKSVFQPILLAEPILTSKITTDPHVLAYVSIERRDDG